MRLKGSISGSRLSQTKTEHIDKTSSSFAIAVGNVGTSSSSSACVRACVRQLTLRV